MQTEKGILIQTLTCSNGKVLSRMITMCRTESHPKKFFTFSFCCIFSIAGHVGVCVKLGATLPTLNVIIQQVQLSVSID